MKKIYKKLVIKLSISAFLLWGSAGLAQTSLNLGGTGNRVETTANFDVTNGFTVEYDVYLNTLQNYNGLVTKGCSNVGSPLDVYINASGQMNVFYGNCNITGNGTSSYNFSAGTWYHIAHTYDPVAQQGNLYVNGNLTDSWYVGPGVGNGTGPMMIGDRADNATDADSKFDNVRVWSGVRTASNIYNYQHVCLTGTETGLEVLYNMEEGSGTTLTDLATGNGSQNGIIIGAVTWDAGLACVNPASALNFDGADDYINISNNPALDFGTGDFTIEASFQSNNSQPGYAGLVTKADNSIWAGFQLVIVNNNIAAEINDGNTFLGTGNGLQGTTDLTDGNWHHVAMVVNRAANNIKLLVDGNIEADVTNPAISTMNINTSADVHIGTERGNGAYINGNEDEIRLWNRALCQGEIQNNMNAELRMPQTGLVAYYKFNQGMVAANNSTVTTAYDSSGNVINGTLNNFALTGTVSNWVAPGAVINGVYTSTFVTPTITVSGNMSICAGTSTTLTAAGADTYTWSTSNNTASIAVTPTANASYSVSGTVLGCATNMGVTTVTVNALPVISSQSGNVKACGDVAASFSVSSADASDSYQWFYQNTVAPYDGDTIDGSYTEENYNTNNMTIDSLITGNYNAYAVYCVVTNTNNCSINSKNDTITVYAAPTATATAGSILCNGAVTTITVSANGGTPAYMGGGTYTVSAGSYTYTVTDANACTATTTITVNEPSALTASVTAGTILCNGDVTTVTVTANGGMPAYIGAGTYTVSANSYTYTITDANSCAATTTIIITQPNAITTLLSPTVCAGSGIMVGTHFYTTAGTYTDVLTGHNGCDSTVTTHLTVNHITAAFHWSPVTCSCPHIGIFDSSYVSSTDPIVAWSWTFPGGTPSTANVQNPGSITFTYGNHVVCLKVTTANGCTDSICKNVFENIMGIDEYNNAPMLTIYPNPAQNNFVIETSATEKQWLEIFDINGKLVLSQNITGTTNIDATNIVSGVYNLSLTGEYGITNKRLVLVK